MVTPDEAIVITGVAAVSALGSGKDKSWRGLLRGESGLSKITRFATDDFPVKVAGEVLDFDAAETIDRRLVVATDRWTQLALFATELALRDADVDLAAFDPDRVAVSTAAGSAGNEFGQREIEALWSRGPRAVTVYQSIAWFYAATTGQISIRNGSKGPSLVLAGGATAGLDVFGRAAWTLASDADIALVGGTEAPVSPYALACQLTSGRLSSSDDPTTAYQPFGRDANGYAVGEGGAMCVVERAAHCRGRGRRPLAVVSGHAASHDGRRSASDDAEVRGLGLCEAIQGALARAGVSGRQIDVVFADGAGSPDEDHAEVAAMRMALGDAARSVPVTVPRSATGRMEAAGGCFDVAIATSALVDQIIPPTVNVPLLAATSEIELVRSARPTALRHALVLARSNGGGNSALVLSTYE